MIRIGFDIGGSKLAAIALDAGGRELGRARQEVPRRLCRNAGGGRRGRSQASSAAHGPAAAVGIAHAGHDRRRRRADPRGQPALARRPAAARAISRRRSASRWRSPTMPTASPCPRRSTAPRRARRGVRRDPGHRRRRRHRGRRQAARRRQRDRRRMGPQPAAATEAATVRRRLRLRAHRLHRDLAERRGARARLSRRSPAATSTAPRSRAWPSRAMATRGWRSARYQRRLATALAGIVNILDPDVIVLGGGLSSIASLYAEVPKLWAPMVVAPDAEDPRWCRPGSAPRAACAAPPGSATARDAGRTPAGVGSEAKGENACPGCGDTEDRCARPRHRPFEGFAGAAYTPCVRWGVDLRFCHRETCPEA